MFINNNKTKIQCLEATDEKNTEFFVIENDISVIGIEDIMS